VFHCTSCSRYKSSLVHADSYLFACQRYIELNPVRAAMVEDPAHYRWTSYRANGLGQPDARLSPHPLYRALGRDDKDRQAAYRALFPGLPKRSPPQGGPSLSGWEKTTSLSVAFARG
jgi:hypothetical protein